MKRPIVDKFIQTEGYPYVKNTETGQQIVYYPNDISNLVLRSMFEEDIDLLVELKRSEKKKILNKLKEEQGENCCFILEEMHQYNADGSRKIRGFAILDANERMDVNLFLKLNPRTKLFEFARSQLLQRTAIICSELFKITNVGKDGIIAINRVV